MSRILPSDICKIHKCGSSIRLDTTLVDFSDMRWERGDISFIFRGDNNPRESLTVLDNEFNCYQRVRYEETDNEIEDEVDILMSSDILAAQMSTKSINFVRAQSGWIFREDKKELVAGQYDCELYSINGLILESRKRREHLSRDDLQKNKAIMESLKGGQHAPNLDQNGEVISFFVSFAIVSISTDQLNCFGFTSLGIQIVRRESLTPPDEHNVSWDDYINAEPGEYPTLGRQLVYKESSKTFRATVAMVNISTVLFGFSVQFSISIIFIPHLFLCYRVKIFH